MTMKRVGTLVVVTLLTAALLLSPTAPLACGPFWDLAVFTEPIHPDFPARYANGELGVLQPTYTRADLYVAYRHLAGKPFSAQEQGALLPGKAQERVDWETKWVEARKRVAGAADAPYIRVYQYSRQTEYFFAYGNCLDDALRNAVSTLDKRIEQFGAGSREVRAWLEAQDQVFANCGGRSTFPATNKPPAPVIPVPAAADMHPLVRADRDYQIAAAHFYAGQFDAARARFEEIAKDNSSPWQKIAPYLAARCLIRKAMLGPEEGFDRATMLEAEMQLRAVLADTSRKELHASAQGLLNFVRFRLYPRERLRELAQALLQNDTATTREQDLVDFTMLLNRGIGDDEEYSAAGKIERRSQQFAALEDWRKGEELTDWILTFQAGGPAALEHTLKRWQETSSAAWLVAGLSKMRGPDAQAPALLAAAEMVPSGSPAYASVAFHRFRLLAEAGKADEARKGLDALLAQRDLKLPASSQNAFLALRMKLAQNLDEFVRFAPRVPAQVTFDNQEQALPETAKNGRFDVDSSGVFARRLPLALLQQVSGNATLTEPLRREVAIAAWTRAILLDNDAAARHLVPALIGAAPELKAGLDEYAATKTAEERKFTAALLILRTPGLRPYVVAGLGRREALGKIDSFRDNWWCEFKPNPGEMWRTSFYQPWLQMSEPLRLLYPSGEAGSPAFLTEAQRAAAEKEWQALLMLPAAPNVLGKIVLDWARKHPQDARAPEALHLVVRATRYGCSDAETGDVSKAAFMLLHQRYLKSEWAKKTPYWFN